MKIKSKEEALFKLGELEEQVKEIKTWLENNSNNGHNVKYDQVREFKNGFAAVKLNEKWGFIDTTGKEIGNIKYDKVFDFDITDCAVVELNGKRGIINKYGLGVCPIQYIEVWAVRKDFYQVNLNHHYGYIDLNGKEYIDLPK
jgi:hypothetical protein